MPLGIYISVPFCRTKCSYCNFASDVFSKSAYENYVLRVIQDVSAARGLASGLGCVLDENVDSIYLGGGTPSILDGSQLLRIFGAIRAEFHVRNDAEITVECAPGTLNPALIDTLLSCGVNRVSLGVQSFVDQEARSVARLHDRATVLEEVGRLRSAAIHNINIDLIAGLPHQTKKSWDRSLEETIDLGVPHVSVYMLEVDEDSRLGRELMAGGTRYHAHFVPDEDMTSDFYLRACEILNETGIKQYEISNFGRSGMESRHNLKYWTRQPYIGFGVDAHSMLMCDSANPVDRKPASKTEECDMEAMRFSTPDSLDEYMNRVPHKVSTISSQAALEERFFLGLRLNRGVDLNGLVAAFTREAIARSEPVIEECIDAGLIEKVESTIRLTPRGRLLSNEVFARFLADAGDDHRTEVRTGNVKSR